MAVAAYALPVVGLLATAVFAPLPFSVAQPGMTANVLGENKGEPVITISGAEARKTSGQLRMTTIEATGPDARVGLGEVIDSWFRTDQAVMPRDAVYPSGDTAEEIQEYNEAEMKESQDTATEAALAYLGEDSDDIEVTLRLADVGGPSAGLLFSSASSTSSTATAAAVTSRAAASSPVRGPSTRRAGSARSAGSPSRPRPPTVTARPSSSSPRPSARTRRPNCPRGCGSSR